jgi:glycosyl transferase family 25
MGYVYIKLDDKLCNSLSQLASAIIIAKYQNKSLLIDDKCKYKDTIFKNYNFGHIVCQNVYNEDFYGLYNPYTCRTFKYNLELKGKFKDYKLFINKIDEFKSSLILKGFEEEYNNWVETIESSQTSKLKIMLNLFDNNNKNLLEGSIILKNIIKQLDNLKNFDYIENVLFIPFLDIFFNDNYGFANHNCNQEKKMGNETSQILDKWVGIIYNKDFLQNKDFVHSLKNCIGLFCMSEQIKECIIKKFNPIFFVETILYPMSNEILKNWNFDDYVNNTKKKIIQISKMSTDFYRIFKADIDKNIKKVKIYNHNIFDKTSSVINHNELIITNKEFNEVQKDIYINDLEYANIFNNNLIFLNIDNHYEINVILDCIKSNCPIIVNRKDFIEEYLGKSYPLYYDDYEDIKILITDNKLKEANEYLRSLNKNNFSLNPFKNKIIKTFINNKIINSNAKKIIGDIPIYYINLERSIDRKEKLESILSDNGLIFERIYAVDGMKLVIEEIKQNHKITENMSNTEIACLLSHIKAITTAYNNGNELALILEDDINFDYLKYKEKSLIELMKYDNKCELIQLGVTSYDYNHNFYINQDEVIFKLIFPGSSAIAYIINREGMKKVLDNFNNNVNELTVTDEYIYKICNSYTTQPYFTHYHINTFTSTIRPNNDLLVQKNSKMRWDKFYGIMSE